MELAFFIRYDLGWRAFHDAIVVGVLLSMMRSLITVCSSIYFALQ